MNTVKVNLWKVESCRETPRARQYSRIPPNRNPSTPNDFVWVPVSVIEHTSRNVNGHHILTLPEWFCKAEGLA